MMKYCITFLMTVLCISGFSQVKIIGQHKLYFGVAYYPELWDAKDIDADIIRMKELNINVVRMGEFAWNKMEPREGVFDFKWLHNTIDKLHNSGIDVILGTPTATPPAWLWNKYPKIGILNENGVLLGRGGRRDAKYTSHIYNEKCKIIAQKMAQEFGKKQGVIAWQIDNEFKLVYDFSEETKSLWVKWLMEKYGDINKLNNKWGANLWSQNYTSFKEVPMPTNLIWYNPSLKFDWAIFTNQQIYNFEQIQTEAIRKHSNLPITHDEMPGQPVDYERLLSLEDFPSINIYHNYKVYHRILNNYDRLRSLNKGMYWLFETSPNYAGGGENGITWFTHEPENSMKAFMWCNYALGGQGAMFWLWKQQWAGQEMVHGSVISAWNKPTANYGAIKELGQELKKSSSFLIDNPVVDAKIGIVYSHISDFGFSIENYVDGLNYYKDWSAKFYQPLIETQLHRDVIYPSHSLDNYKLLIVPMMPYLSTVFKKKLETWVKNGGVLILGPMTGYRTENWTSFKNSAMGNLNAWMGIDVESRIPAPLMPEKSSLDVFLKWDTAFNIAANPITLWADALSTKTGSILASYSSGMQQNKPAIVENEVGLGKVVLLGTNPGSLALKTLYKFYAKQKNISTDAEGSSEVLVVYRGRENIVNGAVIINHSLLKQTITLPFTKSAKSILTDSLVNTSKISLTPFEVMVLKF